MKKFTKLFLTLAVCFGFTTLLTGCAEFFNAMVYGYGSTYSTGPYTLLISDDQGLLDSLNATTFKVTINECNDIGEDKTGAEIYTFTDSLKQYESKSFNVKNKLSAGRYYKLTIASTSDSKSTQYEVGSPNLRKTASYYCFFQASSNYNYKLNISSVGSSYYKFKLSEINKN